MKNLTLPEIHRWCEENKLELIGKGSSRLVYRYNDTQVIKVAIGEEGTAQNQEEYKNYDILLPFLPQIDIDASDLEGFKFLVAECVTPLKNRIEFEKLFNVRFHDFTVALQMAKWGKKGKYSNELQFLDIFRYITEKKPFLKDLLLPSSYGYVIENDRPRLMLVDNGLNNDIFTNLYMRKRNRE